ncbi:hypothetical protein [Streptomyces sp. NPDC088812]|uniref:hypothetical protein n=1 Tax=Streptomyces sp. NPDC088812 TaxID=3365905 RepID=UPI003803CDCA
MTAEISPYLATFVKMASDGRLGWDVVVLAGRGISAYASAQLWMLRDGKTSVDPIRLADAIEEFGLLVEKASDLWSDYDDGKMSEADLLVRLDAVVHQLEVWPGADPDGALDES